MKPWASIVLISLTLGCNDFVELCTAHLTRAAAISELKYGTNPDRIALWRRMVMQEELISPSRCLDGSERELALLLFMKEKQLRERNNQ